MSVAAGGERHDLLAAFHAGVEAVTGRRSVARFLRDHRLAGPVALAAVGKAAADMSRGALDALGDAVRSALLVTKHGHCGGELPAQASFRCLEASHPVPDEASLAGGAALLEHVRGLARETDLLFLTSGGASSLVEVLAAGVSAADLERINRWLLGSGLPIGAMNRVRKRVSAIKAGRLAGYVGARATLNLLVSDVPGDDPRAVGSGLLVPHAPADIDVSDLELPPWLERMAERAPPLAPDAAFATVRTEIVARPADARRAAAAAARARGHRVREHRQLVEGEAAEVGARLARALVRGPPGVDVWSAETTVRLPASPGRGGRCQTLALAAALAIRGRADVWLLAAGTDGSDGPTQDAGAVVDGGTVDRGIAAGLDPERCLAAAGAGSFLAASGDLVRTGPTGTNVMDLLLALTRTTHTPAKRGRGDAGRLGPHGPGRSQA